MEIILNTEPATFDASQLTVQQLLDRKKFTFKLLVIKINEVLVKREDYSTTLVHHGDDVMVLHLMSGG